MNGKDQTAGKSDAAQKNEASIPSTGSSAKSSRLALGGPCEGSPLVGADLCSPAQKAYNAAVRRVDACIARAIAEAVHASLE